MTASVAVERTGTRMNNGRPPYGDPSQWGQQPAAGQEPAALYVQGQAQYGQYPQQGSYVQQTPEGGYPQQAYPQQSYQPPQPYQQQAWQQQMYQPQTHQAQESYQQQTWQPYQQQGYSQQGWQQQGYPQTWQQAEAPMYQQAMQNDQPLQQGYPQQGMQNPQEPVQGMFYPAQGYSGYVSQPKGKEPALTAEVVTKVALFGVLPVLFVLGIVLKSQALCWVFLAAAAATVAAMWLRELVDQNLRLVATMICGVLGVVALVTALNGAPVDQQQEQQGSAGIGANAGLSSGTVGTGMTWEETPSPSPTPTATPDPYAESGAAAEQLRSFFYFWHVNNDENMLALTAPSWRNSQSEPLKALFTIRANRTPADDCEIVSISGSESDTMRTAKVRVTISKNITNREPALYSFNVIMLKEDGVWYVDPRSLASNEKETTTQALYNEMPTQPVLNTGSPSTVLYYNPDGGSYYHYDQNCGDINPKYLPLKGQFLYSQLNDAPYSELENCSYCGAPLREE